MGAVSRYGLRLARWRLVGGRRPRRSPATSERRGALDGLLALASSAGWRSWWRVCLLGLAVLVGSLVAAWPSRARAQTAEPAASAALESLPAAIRPFVNELVESDGYVSDDEAALLPYQRAWAYDRSPLKVGAKSRRIGITWATAYEAVEVAASRADSGGMDVWYMANALDDARVFIDDCAWWVERLGPIISELSASGVTEELVADEKNDILAFTIRFSSGFQIHALTSKPRRLRGKDGYAILDEAAFHDNLGEWIKAAAAFTMWGGRVAIISTYNGVENDFYQLVEDVRSGAQSGSLHEIDIYTAVQQGLYRRIARARLRRPWTAEGEREWLDNLRRLYRDNFAEECECIPSKSGGTYIPLHLIHNAMRLKPHECPVVEFKPSINLDRSTWKAGSWDDVPVERRTKDMRRWLDAHVLPLLKSLSDVELYGGVDFGRTANLTVVTLFELRRDMTRRARLVLELDNVPFAQQDQALDYIWDRLSGIRKVCLDATGIGKPPAEHARDKLGSRAVTVTLNVGWYATHWPALKQRFEDGAIELPAYEPLLADIRSLRRVGGKVEIVGEKGKKSSQQRHGDGAVSLVLAEAAVGTKAEAANTSPVARWGVKAKKRRK